MASQAHILRLPAELRNRIHELALVSDDPIEIDKPSVSYHTAWLDTCRQIRDEARSMFYTENCFLITCKPDDLDSIRAAAAWIDKFDASAKLIQRLEIRMAVDCHMEPVACEYYDGLRIELSTIDLLPGHQALRLSSRLDCEVGRWIATSDMIAALASLEDSDILERSALTTLARRGGRSLPPSSGPGCVLCVRAGRVANAAGEDCGLA